MGSSGARAGRPVRPLWQVRSGGTPECDPGDPGLEWTKS